MILPCIVLIPFISGLICWQSERLSIFLPRFISLFTTISMLVLSLFLWKNKELEFIVNTKILKWQYEYSFPWIQSFGINIHFALDGLSLLMVILACFLGILAVLCSWSEIQKHQGFFYLNILWILGSVIGVFLSIDMFLFFIFWEILAVPIYFLILFWGYEKSTMNTRIKSATQFIIYTQISGLVMLVSIFGLVLTYYKSTGIISFNYEDLLHTVMSKNIENLLMLGFFLSFAIKIPIVPFHSWLPDTHRNTPTAGSVDLSGILLKTSIYGLMRFCLPFFPKASEHFSSIAMYIGLISIFYSALVAFSQNDIKKLIAYSNISHMGFILIAIYSRNNIAYQGATIQIIAHSLSTAGMFIICGQIYERIHTRDMRQMGGLWDKLDIIPAVSLFFAISMIGIPGTGNFIGEIMILFGCFKIVPIIAMLSTFSLIFSSIYSLIMIQRSFYGSSLTNTKKIKKLTIRELIIIILLVLLILIIGLFPQLIINVSFNSIKNINLLLLR